MAKVEIEEEVLKDIREELRTIRERLDEDGSSQESSGSSQRGRPSSGIMNQDKGTLTEEAVKVADKAREKKGKNDSLSTSECASLFNKSDPTARKLMYQLEQQVTDIVVRDTNKGLRLASNL